MHPLAASDALHVAGLTGNQLGAVYACIAAIVAALGDNLTRKSFVDGANAEDDAETASLISDPAVEGKAAKCIPWLWGLGFFCLMSVAILNAMAFAIADGSLVVPFAGLHIVLNLPIAYCMNGEKIRFSDYVGTIITIAGIIGVVLVHASFTPPKVDFAGGFNSSMFKYGMSPIFLFVFVLNGGAFLGSMSFSFGEARKDLECFRLCLASGTAGGLTQLLLKIIAMTLTESCHMKSSCPAFRMPLFWVLIALYAWVSITQLVYLNLAYSRFDVVMVSPLMNSLLIITGCILCAIFFQEYLQYTPVGSILTGFFILVVCVGMWVLAFWNSPLADVGKDSGLDDGKAAEDAPAEDEKPAEAPETAA